LMYLNFLDTPHNYNFFKESTAANSWFVQRKCLFHMGKTFRSPCGSPRETRGQNGWQSYHTLALTKVSIHNDTFQLREILVK
jgi:hypothetical protein